MGNLFSTRTLFSSVFGNIVTTGLFKRPSIRSFSEADYGKLMFRPEDQNTHFLVVTRQDNKGNNHQILFEKKFMKILREAETQRNIESESDPEGLNMPTSDEEAEDERWEEYMKTRRIKT